MYRNSPNPNVPGGKSPAECMFGRKIRTTYDSLRPKKKDARNAANETERLRKFHIGDAVYARNFQGPEKWSSGTVLGKKGNVIYEVDVGKEIWTRHINQLRPNRMQIQYRQEAENFQWDILLDTFGLDDENVLPLELSQNMTAPHSLQLKPSRKRKRPNWLQVNPKKKNYDQIQAVRKQVEFDP
ncbi:hypothetical protein X801_08582 [Opisthorchis viverrini]|uniref:Uncharacterized protein n=1 Tax=Opisthorchis viverrini TaxID=6198 RepID=A0A1S8WMJ2_OPIVI|nr:hypothetical protein X801_08582 [Opisthorchis viverrini]